VGTISIGAGRVPSACASNVQNGKRDQTSSASKSGSCARAAAISGDSSFLINSVRLNAMPRGYQSNVPVTYRSPASTMMDLRNGLTGTGPTIKAAGGAPIVSVHRSRTMSREACADTIIRAM
jgi:hypothetical protein